MKIFISAICFFIAAVSAEAIDFNYIVTQNTYKYTDEFYVYNKYEIINKDTIITENTLSPILYNTNRPNSEETIVLTNENFYIPVTYVIPQGSNDLLPENLITHNDEKRIRNLIPFYYLKVLETGNLNLKELARYEPDYPYDNNVVNLQAGLWSSESVSNYLSNCGIFFYSNNYIAFKNITKINDTLYECEGIADGDYEDDDSTWSSFLRNTPENKTEKFLFEIDGDYLNISSSTNNKPIISLVYVSDSTMDELEHLFRTNKCDVSKVTFPHHADGKTDLDEKKETKSQSIIEKFVYMTVKENLKLRSSENTDSDILTVMTSGADVKILEIGKEETIDGLKSNWVKVEIIYGKDKNGNYIEKGTTGWCYGGYLEDK